MSGEQLHEILKEIDTNMNGQVELDEYLQVGTITMHHKFANFYFFVSFQVKAQARSCSLSL